MTTNIWELVRKRYPAGEYALLNEVRDAAGYGASRSADGIVMGLWPSRGLNIEGIELKSFRSDWLRELKQPKKAENIFQYCNFFWLLTTSGDVAKLEEIPANWGWMTANAKGTKLIVMKQAPMLVPTPVSNSFLAALLKRATMGMVPQSAIEDRIAAARELGKQEAGNNYRNVNQELEKMEKMMEDFQQASGVRINGYRSGNIGEAVKFVLDGGLDKYKRRFDTLHTQFTALCNQLDTAKQNIDNIVSQPQITAGE